MVMESWSWSLTQLQAVSWLMTCPVPVRPESFGTQAAETFSGLEQYPFLKTQEVFVPVILSSAGMNGSFFTSELTVTNRGNGKASLLFTYTSGIGSGSGTATDTLEAGHQRVVGDAIAYLRSIGIPIPSVGDQGGTLRVSFTGLSSPADGGVTVRTVTAVPAGRAGLAYAGIPVSLALTGPSYICGLRQNQTDRSNVAHRKCRLLQLLARSR